MPGPGVHAWRCPVVHSGSQATRLPPPPLPLPPQPLVPTRTNTGAHQSACLRVHRPVPKPPTATTRRPQHDEERSPCRAECCWAGAEALRGARACTRVLARRRWRVAAGGGASLGASASCKACMHAVAAVLQLRPRPGAASVASTVAAVGTHTASLPPVPATRGGPALCGCRPRQHRRRSARSAQPALNTCRRRRGCIGVRTCACVVTCAVC